MWGISTCVNLEDTRSVTKFFFLMQLADGGVAFVAERCPDLEVLGICRCPKLTGKIVEAICEVCVEGLGCSAVRV